MENPWTLLRAGYDRRSLLAFLGLLALYAAVGLNWWELIEPEKGMDWLLLGIWAAMTGLVVWRLDPRRDLPLALVALAGGAVIEWWGTTTGLWRYFTKERPPLWILPAWPVAAMAIDRLADLASAAMPGLKRLGALYWLALPAFVVLMTRFLWPTIHVPSSQAVVALMVGVTCVGARPHLDMRLFVVGASMGLLLEYWGTSRFCWTYYTREIPPPEAILAHGFAAISFARGAQGIAWVRERLPQRALALR